MSTIFRNRGDDNVVTYSFSDIVSGIGYITLYPTVLGSAQNAVLTHETIWGHPYQSDSQFTAGAGFELKQDFDFDIEMMSQTVIEGKGYFNVPVYTRNHTSTSDTNIYIKTIVAKWDGTTETVISSDHQSATWNGTSSTYFMIGVIAEIARTVFKKGEFLRINIELWANGTTGETVQTTLSFNPSNSNKDWDGTNVTPSRTTALIPIKIVR
tara:strand:- start:3951 stop:4583 length:633 start_codon:yes stop_codon:yes gene_type:complete